MKNWKKVAAFATATALCTALIAGCSSSGGSSSGGSNSGSSGESGTWEPNRSITMLVPWSAGGGSDLAVRTLVPYLEDDLGVSITVVNSTGANGWIAWNELLNSDPDGYTIAQMNIPTVYSGYMDPQQNRDKSDRSHVVL